MRNTRKFMTHAGLIDRNEMILIIFRVYVSYETEAEQRLCLEVRTTPLIFPHLS